MKRVIYAGSEFLTGDDIASALLSCSRALAEAGEAETVSLPTIEGDGSVTTIVVLIGPASQIVAMDAEVDADELIDVVAVERLNAVERRLRPVAAVDFEAMDQTDWDSEL